MTQKVRISILALSFMAMGSSMFGCASFSSKEVTASKPVRKRSLTHSLRTPVRDRQFRAEIRSELHAFGQQIVSDRDAAKIAAALIREELTVSEESQIAQAAEAPKKSDIAPKASLKKLASGGQIKNLASKSTRNEKLASLNEAPPMAEPGSGLQENPAEAIPQLKKLNSLEQSKIQLSSSSETPLIFDIPVTYNRRVSHWIRYFQTEGRVSFRIWLERSSRFLPILEHELTKSGMPMDLVYVPMIESGFNPKASSHAGALGLWQFIAPTGKRYGLQVDWWLDERRDFEKSTRAAIGYMTDLYEQFRSWYLVAASYNMGENGVRRVIRKHGTNNFWELADRGALPRETTDYVPKILAAMLISKAPALYGFRDINYQMPISFESITVPGGFDLTNLATYLGVSEKYLQDLNPELIKGFIPREVRSHSIRVPKGSTLMVSQFIRMQQNGEATN